MNWRIITTCLFVFSSFFGQAKNVTLSGFIYEQGSKEALIAVTVFTAGGAYGTTSNDYGFYSLTLPEGTYDVVFDYVGYNQQIVTLALDSNYSFTAYLVPQGNRLTTTEIELKKREKESDKVQMSSVDIPIKQIKEIPALFGEKDVLKVIQLLPGVQSGSEGQSGLYVRGGGPDQNLIILDGATVYNAQHLFGFFSLFNGDALRSVELIKGGFPARYGGRLSSVIDMNMKDGNKEKTTGEVGVGIISSKGILEGPLAKGKGSYILSGRRTYVDALMQPFILATSDGKSSGGYFFYDFNAKANYQINKKNKVYVSGYFGRDKFYFNEKYGENFKEQTKTNFGWGNATGTFRWNHVIGPKVFVNTSLIYSTYNLGIAAKEEQADTTLFELRYGSGIRDYSFKQDFDYYLNNRHKIKFGYVATHHKFTPSALVLTDNYDSSRINDEVNFNAIETGLYVEDEVKFNSKLKGLIGLRLSSFHVDGADYINPEPRIALAYTLAKNLSAKLSYATMNQYIHLLSSSGVGLPTDLWVPATQKVKPQSSSQIAGGLAKDFKKPQISITVEGYYKTMSNIIAYKEGASFLQIEAAVDGEAKQVSWEDNVTTGKGVSYGTELLLQKKYGKFTGWLGYTLSWTKHTFDSINNGKSFYARYDRRHDISVVGQYKINDRMTLSANWVYGTGNAITLPISTFRLDNHNLFTNASGFWTNGQQYTERNGFQMKAYHRADIGLQIKKVKPKGVRTIEFSAYNLYSRKNPFYYYIGTERRFDPNSKQVLKQVSLFPILPSISWNYTFK